MLALSQEDWTGIVAAITAVALLVQTWRTGRVTSDTNAKVQQIDRAVNGKAPGAQTIGDQVQALSDQAFPQTLTPEELDNAAVLPLLKRIALKLENGKENSG